MNDFWSGVGVDLHLEPDAGEGGGSGSSAPCGTPCGTAGSRPGTRLPATRRLAAELGVSRGTAKAAYDQLVAEGYLTARQGSGYPGRLAALRRRRCAGGGRTRACTAFRSAARESGRRGVPGGGLAAGAAPGHRDGAAAGVRLRGSARPYRAADGVVGVPGAGARGDRAARADRDHLRVRAGARAAHARAGAAARIAMEDPGLPFHREVVRHNGGTRGAGAGRRAGRPRAGAGGRRGRGRDAGPPVPDRRDPAPRAAAGAHRLGTRAWRPDRRGRLRRGVPLRPAARGRAPGDGTGAGRLPGHRLQDARARAAARLDGAAAPPGRRGRRRQAAQRPPHRVHRPVGARRADRQPCLRPSRARVPAAVPADAGTSSWAGWAARARRARDRGRAARARGGRRRGGGAGAGRGGGARAWGGWAITGTRRARGAAPQGLVVGYGTPRERVYPEALEVLGQVLDGG